jgi:uncharacterized protein (DUF342 family)
VVANTKFKGDNVQECLKLASVSLGVPIDLIKYSILEEKKGLFKKHALIIIDSVEGVVHEESLVETQEQNHEQENEGQKVNGTIEIKQGKIIIKNPKQDGRPATISTTDGVTIIVDGEKVNLSTTLYEESNIEIVLNEDEAKRHMTLKTSSDKMEAYVSIVYEPNITYKLKDAESGSSLVVDSQVNEKIMPPKFTEFEIKNELLNHNIKYGILRMSVIKCSTDYVISDLLIAKGKKTLHGIDDILESKYSGKQEQHEEESVESTKAVDYKAIGTVEGVKVGQVLATLHLGTSGEDGTDVTGKTIKAKNSKKIVLAAGEGAQMRDECTVVASIEGRPTAKGYTFFVYKIFEVNGDVELKTGDIKFLGDIIIHGSIKEGMKVESGNSIMVQNDVAEAEITASGDVVVKGNVFHSKVSAGKEDVTTLEFLNDLNSMKNDLVKIVSSIAQLKEMNLLDKNTSDGELIKILLETKFKKLPQAAIKVADRIAHSQNHEDELLFIIKHRILELGPLSIVNYEELNDAVTIIDNKISNLQMELTLPVDVVLDYCQESIIKSSGNVIFTGKGQYVSQITASDSVIFKRDKSVARGGVIKAGKEIRCKAVGGHGGVATKLIVGNNGQIWAEIAYANTRFTIGTREYVLDVTSKNVHAYIDESRELVVDKLLM